MSRPLDLGIVKEITSVLETAGYSWIDLAAYVTQSHNSSALTPAPASKEDIPSEWVKAAAEAILQSNTRLTSNAQTFVAQTFARASQYDTVKFSPKQWEWFNKIMLSAGVEAITLEGNRVGNDNGA